LSERDIIVEEAARWSERMSRPVLDSTEAAEFDAWMNADAHHRDAFARLQTLWHSDALQQSLADVIREQTDESPAPSPRFRWHWPVGASAAAAAMVGAFLLAWPATLQNYRTTIGHNAHVMLADGSTVDLGGDAELKVRILPWSRTATLVRGEAFFDVRHEATRRFTLASGDAAIRVLGTAFNVDRQGDRRTVVQVYRGAVELSGPSGERAILRRGTAAHLIGNRIEPEADLQSPDPDWMSGWFDASDVPLQVLVDKLNRVAPYPIVSADADAMRQRITGRFKVSDVPSVLAAMETLYGLRAVRSGDVMVLHQTQSVANKL
jgi:transmembrane sensor